MTDVNAYSNVLYIDLEKRDYHIKNRSDLFDKYIGGAGVAIQLLKEECPPGIDPFDKSNPIIFATGPFDAVYPVGSKCVSMFKSPLTGNLGESHAGGRAGVSLRMAGYGALIVKGKSDVPVYLLINNDQVKIKDASALWGLSNSFTIGRILREVESGLGTRAIMRIGKAGENLVRYASIMTETYRHFGRLGLGAVFGSKLLKAIVISGSDSFTFQDPKGFREYYDTLFQQFTTSGLMKKYHEVGTPMNVMHLQEIKALPTRNLQEAHFEGAEALSGENILQKYLGRRAACEHCPVSCIHIANVREPYESDPYFYKTKMICYDYEPIYSLAAMLDIRDPESFLKLMEKVEMLGVDVMSIGVVMAWATEAMEKGLINSSDTDGLAIHWGDYITYIKIVEKIVAQPNDFYKALAQGVQFASEKYGGEDFALAFGGNEMPGYHTGLTAHLGDLVGARHSHLDAAGYSLDMKLIPDKQMPTPEAAAKYLFEEESWRQILSSLVVCFFARSVYTPEVVCKGLSLIGREFTPETLQSLGIEILREKNRFKLREGFSFEALKIPKRILETESPLGLIKEEDIRAGIASFQSLLNLNQELKPSKKKKSSKHNNNK
jgi:aldehyde:ferredoxin oxidoreductase